MKFNQTYLENPTQISQKWIEAWNTRDSLAIANLFTEDAEFVNVVGLWLWWHDRKAIWKAHDYGLKVIFNNSNLELRKSTIKEISNDAIIIHSKMKLSGQTNHDEIDILAEDRMNIFSFVLKKETRGWVCVSAHNTDIIPGKETNIIDKSGKLSSVDYRKN